MKRMNPKTKGRVLSILFVVLLLSGLTLILYPGVSNYRNTLRASRTITDYAEAAAGIDDVEYAHLLENARSYNTQLAENAGFHELSSEEKIDYYKQLDVTDTGVMGYLEIEKINCFLPICHGTSDEVLKTSVGHVEGTSLPIGGTNAHAVLSAHRSLPSARLFDDLDEMEIGDTFVIHVLNETLTYEVDQIRTVLPSQTGELQIVPGYDYVTLATCTPYSVNTHRLLVRGHRIIRDAPCGAETQ